MLALGEHFRRDERDRHSFWLRQRQWFIRAKDEQQRREEAAEKLEEGVLGFAVDATLATSRQLSEFRTKLRTYETRLDERDRKLTAYEEAVTRALIRNNEALWILERQLASADAELLALLNEAFVLEDGRRVFKTADGAFVIDEHGQQVSRAEVDFELVTGPTAEVYIAKREAQRKLQETYDATVEERRQLIEAQELLDIERGRAIQMRRKLEEANSRLEEGGLTTDELDELDAELAGSLPGDLPRLPASAAKMLSAPVDKLELPSLAPAFEAPARTPTNGENGLAPRDPVSYHDPK